MSPILFYFFAALTLIFGVAVVANRNPVASALCLVVSFLGLASLFVGLDAYFIAVVQVLVYAGAVMVLFLFIIMLLDLKAEERRKINLPAYAGGILVAVAFVAQLWLVLQRFSAAHAPFPTLWLKDGQTSVDDVRNVGTTLFSVDNLPFQVVGVLILVATIGVVVLSKRELK
ncbi:MAG: NADH-quinone oxidoreductase subunit J [Chthoniobacter sp.]|uniref:NADH-quinone oxidoreductase subunit J family protein n=1 Tax=Chthoniobacter sp. TaxID=2510640 RepID=UPI0032A917C9